MHRIDNINEWSMNDSTRPRTLDSYFIYDPDLHVSLCIYMVVYTLEVSFTTRRTPSVIEGKWNRIVHRRLVYSSANIIFDSLISRLIDVCRVRSLSVVGLHCIWDFMVAVIERI